jgi:hypothetical protein
LCALAKVRFLRGYQPKTIACDNRLMLHLMPFMAHVTHHNELPIATVIKTKKSAPLLKKTTPPSSSLQLGFAF